MVQLQNRLPSPYPCSNGQGLRVTPGVGRAAAVWALAQAQSAEKMRLAFLRSRGVLLQKLHDVGTVFIAADVAFVDELHYAGQHICGAAAEVNKAGTARTPLLLAIVQNLQYEKRALEKTSEHSAGTKKGQSKMLHNYNKV